MSSYYPAFKNMLEDLEAGLEEAQDISKYLKPLGCMLENLEGLSYQDFTKKLASVFHVIALVWGNSMHYRHPVRLVVLLQEMSNLIIELVSMSTFICRYLNRGFFTSLITYVYYLVML